MRSWLGLGVAVVGSMGLLGCMGGANGGGEEGGGPGLVMLDAEARAAGFSLVTEQGKLAPVTPVALEGDVTLVGPGQRIPLVGEPGEVLVVTGKRGALVPHTLSKEIDADAVRVSGSEQGVRALATALDAKMSGASGVSGAGTWELRAPGIFASLSRVGEVQGVSAIEALDAHAAEVAAAATAASISGGSDGQSADGAARPFSASDPRFTRFAWLGAHAPVCSDPAVGTWMSTPQMNPVWHVFTLHVAPGAGPGELAGTVSAHVWSGDETEEAPAACGDAETDYRVRMQATGRRAEDGSVRFDAGGWQMDGASCTRSGSGWGYNPDHFSGVVEGGALRTVNNDGGYYANTPVAFERISCE